MRRPLRCISAIAVIMAAAPLPLGADDKKKDPDQIGNRDVGSGVNFYSLEKEIALGKQLAQEIEREAKIVQDPLPAEFVNRLAQNPTRSSPSLAKSSIATR